MLQDGINAHNVEPEARGISTETWDVEEKISILLSIKKCNFSIMYHTGCHLVSIPIGAWVSLDKTQSQSWNHKARSEWESPKTNKDMQLRVQTIVLLILVIPFIGNSFVDWIPAWKWFYSHVQLSIQTWTCMNPEYKLLWIDNAFNFFRLVSWNALQWDICLICPLQLDSK